HVFFQKRRCALGHVAVDLVLHLRVHALERLGQLRSIHLAHDLLDCAVSEERVESFFSSTLSTSRRTSGEVRSMVAMRLATSDWISWGRLPRITDAFCGSR